MSKTFKSKRKLLANISLIIALCFVSFYLIGGCSNDSSIQSDPTIRTLGQHRDTPLDHIAAEVNTAPHEGVADNILLDGTSLEGLNNSEKISVKEAYIAGFTIMLYDATRRDIAMLYRDILDHPFNYANLDSLDGLDDTDQNPTFAIEQHNGVDWTNTLQFASSNEPFQFEGDPAIQAPLINEYTPHGQHIDDWLRMYDDRKQQLLDEGIITSSARELLEEIDTSPRTSQTQEGTLLDLANANIHTTTNNVTFPFELDGLRTTYQMTSKVWIVTADSVANGVQSYMLVAQDFNLANSNGWLDGAQTTLTDGTRTNKPSKVSDTNKLWYLKEFSVSNTYKAIRKSDQNPNQTIVELLTNSTASLADNSPDTTAAETSSETTGVSVGISGMVAANQTQGGIASISGGVSWSSSRTVTKFDININNLSGSNGQTLNDATWQYLPKLAKRNAQGIKADTVDSPAELAHETFTPGVAFYVILDGKYAGQTLELDSIFTIQTRQTYLTNCNFRNSNCDEATTDGLDPVFEPTHTQTVAIPVAPES
ncbi:MAG: hypothetical protein AAF462_05525 [Thermodesulfobacteriota bacterium]